MPSKRNYFKLSVKVLTLIGLVLLTLWLAFPLWFPALVKIQLPKQWSLTQLEVGRPSFDQWNVHQLQLSLPQGHQISAKNIQLSLLKYASFDIVVQQLNIFLQSSDNAKNESFPQIEPLRFDHELTIEKLRLKTAQVSLEGNLQANHQAAMFNGKINFGTAKFMAFDANILGFDGNKDLEISVATNKQFFNLQHPWRDKNQPQLFSVSSNIQQPIVKAALDFAALNFPEDLQIQSPEIATQLNIKTTSWPKNKNDLFSAAITGDASLRFTSLSSSQVNIAGNTIDFKFSSKLDLETQLTIFPEKDIYIQTEQQKEKIDIRLSHAKPVRVKFTNQKLNLQASQLPVVHIELSQQQIDLIPKRINYFFDTDNLDFSSDIKVRLIPNLFPLKKEWKEPFKNLPKVKLNTHVKVNAQISQSKLQMDFFPGNLTFEDYNTQEDLTLSATEWLINPFQIKLDLNNFSPELFLDSLTLSGTANSQAAYLTLSAQLHSDWKLSEGYLTTNIIASNKGEKIQMHALSHVNKNETSTFKLSSEKLTAANWPIPVDWLSGFQLDDWLAHFFIETEINLKSLEFKNIIPLLSKSLSENSWLNLSRLNLSYEKLTVSDMELALKISEHGGIITSLNTKELATASGISIYALNSLISEFMLFPTTFEGIELHFDVFQGKLHIVNQAYDSQKLPQSIIVSLENLDLEMLADWLKIEGLTFTGKLSGTLPIVITEDGIEIQHGKLASSTPGIIRYLPDGLADPSTNQNVALQALQNFHYKQINLELNYDRQGNYSMDSRILGANPDLYDGDPIALNPKLQGNLPDIFWSLFVTGDFERSLLKKLNIQ